MALRPGRRLEMSSHFIPLPRSSMISASSSGDHLLCFLTGCSELWVGMLRLPVDIALGATGAGTCAIGRAGADKGTVTDDRGADCTWRGVTEDSSESGALRRAAISTVAAVPPDLAAYGLSTKDRGLRARSKRSPTTAIDGNSARKRQSGASLLSWASSATLPGPV